MCMYMYIYTCTPADAGLQGLQGQCNGGVTIAELQAHVLELQDALFLEREWSRRCLCVCVCVCVCIHVYLHTYMYTHTHTHIHTHTHKHTHTHTHTNTHTHTHTQCIY